MLHARSEGRDAFLLDIVIEHDFACIKVDLTRETASSDFEGNGSLPINLDGTFSSVDALAYGITSPSPQYMIR